MSTSDDRAQHVKDGAEQLREMGVRAKTMKEKGYSNAAIADAMGISENYVRGLVHPEIDWRQNCLTSDVHDGRPEAIWNIPLVYAATVMFSRDELTLLVLTRIHKDALQITLHNEEYTTEWANRVRAHAEEKFINTLTQKVGEITKYYKSPGWESDQQDAVRRFTEDKLNPGFAPLHPHDTINMLCRIIGVSSSIKASKEISGE